MITDFETDEKVMDKQILHQGNEKEYEVEKILDHGRVGKKIYLKGKSVLKLYSFSKVLWKG